MATKLVTIDPGRLADMKGRLTRARETIIRQTEKALDEYGSALVVAIQQNAPQDKGVLQSTVKYQIKRRGTKNMELRVTMGNKDRPDVVVKTILFGSRPHIIEPKRKGGVLHWVDAGGRDVFAKRVHHPGTKPNDYLGRAYQDTLSLRRSLSARIGKLVVNWIQNGTGNVVGPGE